QRSQHEFLARRLGTGASEHAEKSLRRPEIGAAIERGGMMKRVVVITGVAGGIGRGTARVFYEAGWVVVGIDRKNADDMHDVHRFIHADISDADAPHQIFETIAGKEGRLDALVNNAACQVCKPILETTPEEWDQV